ncbi:unnamed protein product, partial [marine sediment metagenome]
QVTAKISVGELMKIIDKISKQLEDVLNKWYKEVLEREGLPLKYAPEITIIDSELMEIELRMAVADHLFNKYGMAYESVYDMLGVDYNSEKDRRIGENEEDLDKEVFYPRETAFTYSAKGKEDYNDETVDNKDKQNKTTNEKVKDEEKKEENNE